MSDPKRHKAISMLKRCRKSARYHAFPCTITIDDILEVFPDSCPVLGMPFDFSQGMVTGISPSLDKFYPELGYIKGNIHVISLMANQIKSNGSFEDVRKVAEWMEVTAKKIQDDLVDREEPD